MYTTTQGMSAETHWPTADGMLRVWVNWAADLRDEDGNALDGYATRMMIGSRWIAADHGDYVATALTVPFHLRPRDALASYLAFIVHDAEHYQSTHMDGTDHCDGDCYVVAADSKAAAQMYLHNEELDAVRLEIEDDREMAR